MVESNMKQTNYEGTWEEILTHTSELKGKKVKLTVIDDTEQHQTKAESKSLSEVLKGKIGIIEGASPELSQNTGQQYLNLLLDKHRSRS